MYAIECIYVCAYLPYINNIIKVEIMYSGALVFTYKLSAIPPLYLILLDAMISSNKSHLRRVLLGYRLGRRGRLGETEIITNYSTVLITDLSANPIEWLHIVRSIIHNGIQFIS